MLTSVYPLWYILFCVLLGIGYAVLLYRKDKAFGEETKILPYFLGALRFFSVSILAFLLLEPLVKTENQIIEKPIIVIAQDNSESIQLSKDSSFYIKEYPKELTVLKEKLSEKYTVETFHFGGKTADSLKFDYDLKQTDISDLFENIEQKYYGRNLGGVILASDGIINKGLSPEYAAKNIKNTVVYTIAMGDTAIRKDLIIQEIHNNDIAYKGNEFPVEVNIKANYLSGENALVSIWKNGKKLQEKKAVIQGEQFILSTNFLLPATASGKQKYRVNVSELAGELTNLNNTKDFYINVIENKQDILILADAPHPDIAAIRGVLNQNKNYNTEVKLVDDFKDKIGKYSLVILHGIPNYLEKNNRVVEELLKEKIPLLICATEHTNYNKLNQLKQQLTVIGANGYSNATGSLNASFNKFTISDALRNDLSDFTPLQVPFANGYKIGQRNNVLLYQKIGGTITNYPLLTFNENDGQKLGFLLGEGIWRWKYLDHLKNGSNNNFNELIQKTVQYLVAKKDKSQFRISNRSLILENEALVIDAELYNDSYELVNTADVIVKISNNQGEEYPAKTMAKSGNAYRLNAGKFKAGEYTYIASTSFDGKVYEKKGKFSVKELKVEYVDLVANHKLLYNLSVSKNGKMFYPNELKALAEEIYTQDNIVPISYTQQTVEDLIQWKWIFGLVILLLTIEWFLRKRNGGY
ncbi:MAG: hypothetical protein N4A35_03840 [Flavobacteriales bacterium]|jgi:hypothetical protein|nr:hypothetical protein [Flavobacteriales bacterium]